MKTTTGQLVNFLAIEQCFEGASWVREIRLELTHRSSGKIKIKAMTAVNLQQLEAEGNQ